jgi:NADH-quinone oxidoreductase subunit M
VQAPPAGSVILAGVLLKMGTYGFLRFNLPLFPDATHLYTPLLAALAIIGILYGALVALVQKDVKSLVAYSSIAHLGFVMLGIVSLTAQGVSGAVLQGVNHGLSTGALFLMIGMVYDRRHTRLLSEYGGLWKKIPVWSAFFIIVVLASVGLPGLNGFVGEFAILVGAFQANPWWAVFATLGVIFAAWYLLTAVRGMVHGPLDEEKNGNLTDLSKREILVLAPLVILFFVIGLFPGFFFDKINPAVDALLQTVHSGTGLLF